MTASLQDRIAIFISDNQSATADDVIAHVRRRATDIRRVLNSGAFSVAVDARGTRHYFLAIEPRDGRGRP